MCLDTVTCTIAKPTDKEVVAWKTFTVSRRGRLQFMCMYDRKLRRGVWMHARQRDILLSGSDDVYASGFHAWSARSDAMADFAENELGPDDHSADVFQVRLRGVRTIGTQERRRVIVADYLFIPKNAKPEPR